MDISSLSPVFIPVTRGIRNRSLSGYSIDDLAGEAGSKRNRYTECYRGMSTGCNFAPAAHFTGGSTWSNAPGGGGADGFVLIVQGGLQVRHDRLIADMAEGTERDGSWTGKRIFGERPDNRVMAPGDSPWSLSHGKRSRRS